MKNEIPDQVTSDDSEIRKADSPIAFSSDPFKPASATALCYHGVVIGRGGGEA